ETEFRLMDILTQTSPKADVERFAGGKGRGLFRLTEQGLPVPAWAVVGVPVFRAWLERTKLDTRIQELLSSASSSEPQDLERIAGEIEAEILGTDLDAQATAAISQALTSVGTAPVAVRSSGFEEDGKNLSFAGQFSSYLNVKSAAEARDSV